MRIAIFDYSVVANNPAGSCHLRLLESLCAEHEFTVFAVKFENPSHHRIRWVRVPAPTRPLALLFLGYHLLAPLCYWAYRLRRRMKFDLVQVVESNLSFGQVVYSHFCHRHYLRQYRIQPSPGRLRGWLRWLDHRLHALLEPWVYRTAKFVVVPSRGLARDLNREYPCTTSKTWVIPNPLDLPRMAPPPGYDRRASRQSLGIRDEDVALVFVALGHFERKGLPVLLRALEGIKDDRVKLVIVGGEAGLVAAYGIRAERLGLNGKAIFAGMQSDVRPYYWAADAFVLPSVYETFSLVTFEAAAAGLPIIVSRLNGVEELLADGRNGLLAEPTAEGIAAGIRRFLALPREARASMGLEARLGARSYGTEQFVGNWRSFYRGIRVG